MTVYYEWDVEETEVVDGEVEVVEHWFQTSYKASYIFKGDCPEMSIVLVRDDNNGRSWAYIQANGELPEHFCNAWGVEVHKVPNRFHEEVRKFKNKC